MMKHICIILTVSLLLVGCGGSSDSSTTQNGVSLDPEQPVTGVVVPDNTNDEAPDLLPINPIVETKTSNWFIRIVAEDLSRDIVSQNAQLGLLDVSDAVQKHTLKTYYAFDGDLDVLFVDPEGVAEGQYKTNYHIYQNDVEEQWHFTVMSSDPDAEIILSWRGLYVLTPYEDAGRTLYSEYRSTTNPLIKFMKLIDVKTMEEIAIVQDGEEQTYTFNMDGENQREFYWVVSTEEVNITPEASSATIQKVVTEESKPVQKAVFEQNRIESFDLDNPPFAKEGGI